MLADTISGRQRRKTVILLVSSVLALAYILGPILWAIVSSFQKEQALEHRPPYFFPTPEIFTLSHYYFIFTGIVPPDASTMIQGMYTMSGTLIYPGVVNSLIVAAFVTLVNVVVGFPTGHVLARYRFLGDHQVFPWWSPCTYCCSSCSCWIPSRRWWASIRR